MKHWTKRQKALFAGIVGACLAIAFLFFLRQHERGEKRTVVTIAVAQNDLVQSFQTNYFKEWLERETGYEIRFELMSAGYEKEYLNAMLSSDEGRIDAVFLPEGREFLSVEEFHGYVQSGQIANLSSYVNEESNLLKILEKYGETVENSADFEQEIYYMPRLDTAQKSKNMQVMWINVNWLKKLSLQVPKTTQDLKRVLTAFRDQDPNGNGERDELPFIWNRTEEAFSGITFLLNAFVYTDPYRAYYYRDADGKIKDVCQEQAFRQGVEYCAQLHAEGLLSDVCVDFGKRQLQELVNAQEDIVGAFTAQSIVDVIYPGASDVFARYIQVPPLTGASGVQNAVKIVQYFEIGGYIPANAVHKKEAFDIMDRMLSTDASLIACFGEEGIDWRRSESGELSGYGVKAKVTTLNYLTDKVQNKHFAGAGPRALDPEYANEVNWNGSNSMVEYIDARAVRIYENYYRENAAVPKEKLLGIPGITDRKEQITQALNRFILGGADPAADTEWESFLNERRNEGRNVWETDAKGKETSDS